MLSILGVPQCSATLWAVHR